MVDICITSQVPERRERWCYFVPAHYRLRRVWRTSPRKLVKQAKVTW